MNHPLISALCAAMVTLTAGDLTSAPVNPVPSVAAAGAATAADDGTGFAGAYAPSKHWHPPKDPLALAKLRKFQDLKFGFFFCWGTQTQWDTIDQSWSLCPERYDWNKRPGAHANDDTLTYKTAYEALLKTFNPVKFDPQAVAALAEAAGTRYLVFCTKHHDGFCFWDTKTTKLNGEAIYDTRPLPPYELGNCFFTRKPDGTIYVITLSEKDGQPMPSKVVISASLMDGNARVSLIGGDRSALPMTPGPQDTVVVALPAVAPCAEAWTLKITRGKPDTKLILGTQHYLGTTSQNTI